MSIIPGIIQLRMASDSASAPWSTANAASPSLVTTTSCPHLTSVASSTRRETMSSSAMRILIGSPFLVHPRMLPPVFLDLLKFIQYCSHLLS